MKSTFSRKILFVDSEQVADNINMLLQKNKVQIILERLEKNDPFKNQMGNTNLFTA